MQLSLNKFALQLEENSLLRHVFFMAAAVASIFLIGYHFGTFDQSVHLPFLKAFADPSLYPADPFITLRNDQYSFFWYFFLPFLKLGILEPAMFLVHLLVTALFFKAVWELGITLFGKPMAALFAVLSFIIPHFGFVGFPVIEFSLQSRTFVLPFLLMAVNSYLRGRPGFAFFLLGLMYNLNLLMTNFVLVILVISSLANIRKIGWKKAGFSAVLFLIGALPVLIWKMRSGTGLDLSLRPEWLSAISRGTMYQIFYIFSNTPFMLLTLSGICGIVMFFIAKKNNQMNGHAGQMKQFVAILIGILTFQIFSIYCLPLTFIIQLQISRACLFILIFAYICFAGYLADEYHSGKISGGNFLLIFGCLVLSISAVIPLLAWIIHRKYPSLLKKGLPAAVTILVILVGLTILGFKIAALWRPGIHVYADSSPWIDIQNWARKNSPKEAIFITPPQEAGPYQPDWRVFSERSSIASLYDLFEIALKPDYFATWKPRFESLAPEALEKFQK